jgi:hypothetical protein
VSDFPPPDRPPQPLPSPGDRGPRWRRTPLLVALGTAAVAALIIGGVAVGSGGGDDDSAPAPSTILDSQETSDPTAVPLPTSQPAPTPSTTPTPTTAAVTTTTTAPAQVDTDPSAVAAANVGVLAEQERPPCPVDVATLATLADGLGGSRAQQKIGQDQLSGTTMFRRRLTKAAAVACVAGTREKGVALYVGPLGDASLQTWTNEALLNDNARLRELSADGDATVVAVDSSTEVANFTMAQKGAAWTDGTVVVMSVGVSFDGQRVDADSAAAGAALVEAVPGIVTQLAGIELPAAPPNVPIGEPIDTSTAVTKLVTVTEQGRSNEPMECPVSIAVLDAFNEPVNSTFVNRILDESSGVMGARVESYRRRGPTVLRCSAGIENGLVSIYLGRLQGADPSEWLSMIEPTVEYKQVGTEHQGSLLAVRVRQPTTAIHGAAWTDGSLIVMVAAVGRPAKVDFTPDQAATGLSPALQAIVTELQAR